jgi:hypothetical protein
MNRLEFLQTEIGVSDAEVAARARWSTRTFQKAKRGQVPEETEKSFIDALDSLRVERIKKLSSLKCKAVS